MDGDFLVEVDRDLCLMAENCSLHALGDATASTAEELVTAEFECPSGAIQLRRQ